MTMFEIRSIKEVVLSRLKSHQVEELCHTFVRYTFLTLDAAAELLQPKVIQKSKAGTPDLEAPTQVITANKLWLRTAARVATVTATAIFLSQSVASSGYRPPLGSRTSCGEIYSKRLIGTCPIRIRGVSDQTDHDDPIRLSLNRPNALEILEHCDRLRKEFGVYAEPSKILSKQSSQDHHSLESWGGRRQAIAKQSLEFQKWVDRCNKEGVDQARKTFWELGSSQIEEAAEVILCLCVVEFLFIINLSMCRRF